MTGGALLAVSMMLGTAVGPAAAAETPAAILDAACEDYVPEPDAGMGYSDCRGADLTGADLTNVDLRFADLTNANLTNAILYHATLTGGNLTGATLAFANFSGATLTGADLTDANLTNTYLYDADLTKAILADANLTSAILAGANLTGADLHGANLTGANLSWAILTDAGLTGSSAVPGDVSVPAQSAAGATATWTIPTRITGLFNVICDHSTGMIFPVGISLVTCKVRNDKGTGFGQFTVTVGTYTEAPTFTDTAPVALIGTGGTSLTRTFTVTGTPAPAVTVVDPTKLPPGTTFANDPVTGVPTLSGTPTAAGKYNFMVTATNGTTPDATLQVTVNVTATPVIDPPATRSLRSLFGS